jgi:16S rRNA (guanine966-N2)-methyltransferase
VREAVFSALEARGALAGGPVLDLFAGSGALGLEAASRGARTAVLVDSAAAACRVAAGNAARLGLGARVARQRAEQAAAVRQPEAPFEVVFLDPPYDHAAAAVDALLAALGASGNAGPGSVIVLERRAGGPAPIWPDGWEGQPPRRYGDTAVWLARVVGLEP